MTGEPLPDFRPGDVLRISCPFTEVTVSAVHPYNVSVRWPWWQVDPDSDFFHWNGDVALPRASSMDAEREFFTTIPDTEALAAGDRCKVGIPPTIVHVMSVERFDPPLETGRLPRPHRHVVVLHHGESEDPDAEFQGYIIDPDDDQPIAMDLVFRPYAFLRPDDELADAAGRAWRFVAPWDWRPFDGGTGTPVWPLTLLYRDGAEPSAASLNAVAQATSMGSHTEQLARWQRLTGAHPPERSHPASA
ncbi:hypothetical protein GCM10009527_027430 [Actinomadura nitritigenes]|uniref:Uncharacterized protein n=1 Tax=Actinomadura nitritigenes TaxID=134602 RepID=A0ABS3R3N5_9ACTN|nr:hypothetical protein [Actinomadura nitritigenes]MBO2440736.1 hypothetical protein [Actinomadura nitritigenes]